MTLELIISIEDIENPRVWRKVLVTENISFHDLHTVIQLAFGWDDYHLYKFLLKDKKNKTIKISKLSADYYEPDYDSEKTNLSEILNENITEIEYIYDFGDQWTHKIEIKRIETEKQAIPICIEGEGACPPEDCGGALAYMEMKETLKRPESKEYSSMMKWLNLKCSKEWNLKYFDKVMVNRFLEEEFVVKD